MRISDWSSDVCSSDLICLSALLGIIGIFYWMGVEIVQQAAQLRETIVEQVQRVIAWLEANGIMPTGAQLGNLGSQLFGSLGRLTAAVGSVLGAITSLVLVIVIGVFVAMEPRLYERGLAWMQIGRASCRERVCQYV